MQIFEELEVELKSQLVTVSLCKFNYMNSCCKEAARCSMLSKKYSKSLNVILIYTVTLINISRFEGKFQTLWMSEC